MNRCSWCEDNPLARLYHDEEWGVPLHDDRKQFEFLMMEVMQCGLSWNLMLKKRDTFRRCFDDFDYERIAAYDETDIERIMNTKDMIKSERKIKAVIENARAYLKIIEEFGSFDTYLWRCSGGKTLVYKSHRDKHVASNELSEALSKDLKKRGFKFLGPVTLYSHLQACGLINDHAPDCFRYTYIMENFPVEIRE